MLKTLLAAAMLLALTATAADAAKKRKRITVYPQQRVHLIPQHPVLLQAFLEYVFCGLATFSAGPDGRTPPCASRYNYVQPRRRMA